jgi:hypothetical protein
MNAGAQHRGYRGSARARSGARRLAAGVLTALTLLIVATAAPAATATSAGTAAQTTTPPGSAQFGPNAATLPDPTEDIRDIRGPKYLPPPWLVPAIVGAALALALAGYGAWRWHKRRQRPRTLSLFEAALQRLEELRPLMQPARAREFSIGVSDIVRGYIEQRFDATAAHRTTEEFLHDLLESTNPGLARHRTVLSEFLHQCDLVKFAGVSLSVQNMEALQRSARAFVIETAKPEPEVKATTPDQPKETHDSLPAT